MDRDELRYLIITSTAEQRDQVNSFGPSPTPGVDPRSAKLLSQTFDVPDILVDLLARWRCRYASVGLHAPTIRQVRVDKIGLTAWRGCSWRWWRFTANLFTGMLIECLGVAVQHAATAEDLQPDPLLWIRPGERNIKWLGVDRLLQTFSPPSMTAPLT